MRDNWLRTILVLVAIGTVLAAGMAVQRARMQAHQMPGYQAP
jgi:hypothetical protein